MVIGGSHVTFMADEALEHADYVARGEGGEQLMAELIEALSGDRELDSIAGLSFRRDGRAVHNPLRARCADLDSLPFPALDLLVGHEKITNVPIMTSWGCPFGCTFCSVTAMFGRKYRFRSAENVVAEIKAKRPKKIFFCDDNLAADTKRLKRLLELMIAEDLVIPWSAQVRTDVARDPELLELMRRSGCGIVYLGLESVSQETLDGFHKSQSVADIERAIRVLHDHGIKSHGMFVLGADTDDVQTVRDTVSFAIANHIDTLMPSILTPLPGTPLFEELDAAGRIFDKRWQLYDAHHVVYEPALMTPYELQMEILRGCMRFYSLRTGLRYIFTLRFTQTAAVPLVGQGHHPQLAQGRSQPGVHGRSQTHGAAVRVRRDDEPGHRGAARRGIREPALSMSRPLLSRTEGRGEGSALRRKVSSAK